MSSEKGGRYLAISKKQTGAAKRIRYNTTSGDVALSSGKQVRMNGAGEGVRFGTYEATTPPANLRVLRVEGPFDEEGRLVTEIRRCKSYQYRATRFSRAASEAELRTLQWGFGYDSDAAVHRKPEWSARALIEGETVTISLATRGDVPLNTFRVYAFFREPSEGVRASATIAPPRFPVVVERYRRPGRNQDGTRIADDMAYGTGTIVEGQSVYTEAQIRAVGTQMNATASGSEWALWADFRLMARGIFSRGELNDNIGRMIDKFQRAEGGEYNDPVLTRAVREHESTLKFCTQMEDKIAARLKEHEGGIECIADEEFHFEYLPHPVFNSNGDTFWGGLTIAINDVWSHEVVVTSYSRSGDNFTAKYTVTLWDHFGLDMPDVQKKFGALAGFRAWFVLQHLRGYRPFITKIEFEKEFTGSISAGTVQRAAQ